MVPLPRSFYAVVASLTRGIRFPVGCLTSAPCFFIGKKETKQLHKKKIKSTSNAKRWADNRLSQRDHRGR